MTIQDRLDMYDSLIAEIKNAMNENGKLWCEQADEWLSLEEWKEKNGIDLQIHLDFFLKWLVIGGFPTWRLNERSK